MNIFSSLASLPIWVKIILGVLLLGVLVFVGIIALMVASIRTEENTLVDRTCGADRLKITVRKISNVGNTSTDYRLYWNDKIVANKGDVGASGQPILIPPIDPDDQKGLIVKLLADTIDATTWTVRVNPKQFSRADFDAITACLKTYNAENPRSNLDSGTVTTTIAYTNFARVGQLIYGELQSVKLRVYAWKPAWEEKPAEIMIHPNGRVDLRRDYRVEELGHVSMADNQRVLTWNYTDESPLLGRNLAGFKNEVGQSLASRYELRHHPDDNQVFVRQTAKFLDWVFIRQQSYDGMGGNFVSGHTIDLTAPILRQHYDAGIIETDSLNPGQPVFVWKTWPEHPLTETDLRQFRNEQGQKLGDLYRFTFQP